MKALLKHNIFCDSYCNLLAQYVNVVFTKINKYIDSFENIRSSVLTSTSLTITHSLQTRHDIKK